MNRNSILRQISKAAAVAAAGVMFGTAAYAQDIPGCQRAIAKNAQKYASARMKALQKCEEGRLTGKITTTCALDAKTQDKINKAATKFSDKVAGACASVTVADLNFDGLVNRCVGGNGDGNRCVDVQDCRFPPATTGPEDGICSPTDECPTFLNGRLPGDDGCEIALASPADVGDCIECATAAKVDSLISTFYTSLAPESADKDVLKCQKDIGKRTAKFFDKVEKALAKCEDARIKDPMVVCPDAKTNDKIAKALAKFNEAIAKTCVDGATIGAAGSAAQIWGQSHRYGTCPVTGTQTPAGLSGALACLAQSAAGCDIGLSIASNACSIDNCGNGQIDPGETCDDGNTVQDIGEGGDDVCPADCDATCAVSGSQSVTINLAATPATNLLNATVLLSYNDDDVNIGGIGNDPPVLAAVTSGVFATTPRDSDTSLRISLEDPSFIGVPAGPGAASVTFNVCGGAAVTVADFGCVVVSATDDASAAVTNVTCTVSVP